MNSQLTNQTNVVPYPRGDAGRSSEDLPFDLVQKIEQHATERPSEVAVSFGAELWTYQELVAAADRLAYRLRQEHVCKQSRVAICAPPDLYVPVALLAIMKLGAVYVPIGADYPKARLQAVVEDVQPVLVLTVGTTEALFDDVAIETRDLTSLCAPMDIQTILPSVVDIGAKDDAYIFYTSGTTGAPKGIAVSYGALSFYVHAGIDTFGIDSSDVMMSVAKYSFSISLFELLCPLVAGGRLMLLERDQVMVAAELTKALQQATVAHIGPSLLKKTLEHIKSALIDHASFNHVRHISAGGDVVSPELIEGMKEVFQRADVCAIYGCTEIACMGCTYFAPRDQLVDKTYVGKPFAGADVVLLGEDDQPVAKGDVGEVLFSGPGLLNGYVNKPHLTAKKRIVINSTSYFRTGDLGRFGPSGDLELLGRRDFQVKVRGLRIEPVEIEVHLRRVPGIHEAVVATADGKDGEKRLVAYLVIGDQAPPSISIIRSHLAEHLPDYMIPSVYVTLESLPLNQNLKVDRNALPAPSSCRQIIADEQIAPRNDMEARLAQIWRNELDLASVGVTDNFFDLGGDSLLAVTLCLIVSESFDVALRPSALYESAPTIEELARLIVTRRQRSQPKTAVDLDGEMNARTPADQPLPILPPATRFLKERDNLDPHRWNIAQLLEYTGRLNQGLLEQAVGMVAKRHDALDLHLTDDQSSWFSLSEDEAASGIVGHVDFSAVSDRELPQAIGDLAEREHAGLHLNHGPVVRVVAIDLGLERPHRLLIIAHHLAVDGTSWPVLVRDIVWIYEQLTGHRSAPLVAPTASYREWGETLLSMGTDPTFLRGINHWTDRPWHEVKPLPRTSGGSNTNQSVRTVETRLSVAATNQLRALLPRGRSITEILIPTLARVISRWAKSNWVLIDSLEDGRNLPHVETIFTQSIGFMGCYIPLLLHASGPASQGVMALGDVVKRGREEGYAHDVLRYLASDPAVRTRMAALPRAEIIFNYGRAMQNFLPEDTQFRDAKEPHGNTHNPMNPRDYVLGAVADRIDGQLALKLVYSENLNDRTTINSLLDAWEADLDNLI